MSKTRLLGIVIPVGALRSSKPAAVGEYPDLGEFALLCKKMKVGLIQLLPVNDTGGQSSPYFSLTAFALHPLYIRIGDLPEAADFKDKTAAINKEFGGQTRFSYHEVLQAKMELLHEIYTANTAAVEQNALKGELGTWIEQNPWVKAYSVYRRLKGLNEERSWKEWPDHREVTPADIAALWQDPKLRGEHLFWVWVQHAADVQFSAAAKIVKDAGIILKGDLPILMNDDSCDVWAHPELFDQNLSAGAPPDMYSPKGQNWGFPLYDWATHEKDGYAWWKQRLIVAAKYYQAYRIDHVLGFFRIWASSPYEYADSSMMGRYIPYAPITNGDMRKLGFDKSRVRWVSRPHIPTAELTEAIRANISGEANTEAITKKVFSKALDRVSGEELWLFKKKIQGEKSFDALGLHQSCRSYLSKAWQDRIFFEYEKGRFSPTWHYKNSRAYQTLSNEEKEKLEELLKKRQVKSEKMWEAQGKKLLSMLVESSSMIPCAEDLGTVPNCVIKVLAKLKILGLRVVRWQCLWDTEDKACIPFEEYPELSVCTLSLHDSTTSREWWETEANQEQFSGFLGYPSLPKVYNPGTAKIFLAKAASARSRFRIFLFQDILHLSHKWYADDPASERINVPGTDNDFNWTYRIPAPINELSKDKDLVKAVAEISRVKAAKKNRGNS